MPHDSVRVHMSSDRRNPLLRYFSWFLKIIYPPHAIAFILQSGNVLKAIAQTVARSLAFCPANRDKAESMYNQHNADIRALQWHARLFLKLCIYLEGVACSIYFRMDYYREQSLFPFIQMDIPIVDTQTYSL